VTSSLGDKAYVQTVNSYINIYLLVQLNMPTTKIPAVPTAHEVAALRNAVVVKGGGYTAVRDALAQKRQGQRGPQLAPTKLPVTVRYNPEVVAYFKATGAGWQTRMNDALCEWVAKHKTA
jgi:uncharacterized protein (DUF4415 family)